MKMLDFDIIEYNAPYQDSIVVCLGFFDSIHQGHIQLFRHAELVANLNSNKVAVFTFENNPFELLNQNSFQVLSFEERCLRFKQNSIRCVLKATFDEKFADMQPVEFLDKLCKNKKITNFVVGEDYTFGKNAAGDIRLLKEYCDEHNITLNVTKLKKLPDGEKYSSRNIRSLIRHGKVDEIYNLLNAPYIIAGQVIKGRMIGKKIGFPTANIALPNKERLAAGVYYTNTIVDGVALRSITNVGEHPTFDDKDFNIETHILYFNQDIYGKNIVVEFYNKIRDIKKFDKVEQLVNQLKSDCELIKNI